MASGGLVASKVKQRPIKTQNVIDGLIQSQLADGYTFTKVLLGRISFDQLQYFTLGSRYFRVVLTNHFIPAADNTNQNHRTLFQTYSTLVVPCKVMKVMERRLGDDLGSRKKALKGQANKKRNSFYNIEIIECYAL